MFAILVLNRLYQPLVPPDIAQKLYIAAATAVIKPQSTHATDDAAGKKSGTLEAAQYIAKIAVNELHPVGAGGKSTRGDLFTLFKGIIKTLQEMAQYDQVSSSCVHTAEAGLFGVSDGVPLLVKNMPDAQLQKRINLTAVMPISRIDAWVEVHKA